MKKKRIVILVIIILILLIGVAVYAFYDKTKKEGNFLVGKESFDLGQMTKLTLDGEIADYNIKFTKSGQCTIEEYANVQLSDKEKYSVEYNGDEFKISNPIDETSDISGLKRITININIPENVLKDLDLSFDVGNLVMDSESSSIQLDKLKIYTDIGDIDVNKVLNVKTVEITDSIGNETFKGISSTLANITNGTGNITIGALKFDNTSKIETDVGDIKVGVASDCYIDAKTNTGAINIDKNFKTKVTKNSIALILKDDIGNISVTDKR